MMIRPRTPFLLGLACTIALAACEPTSELSGPIPDGWFRANIEGSQSIVYKGTGFFHSNKDISNWPEELRPRFVMVSDGILESAGTGIAIIGGNGDRPEVGIYDLGWSEGGAHDWQLVYSVSRSDSIEFYGATSGELEITRSNRNVLEGKFDLTASGNLVCHKSVRSLRVDPDETPELPCAPRDPEEATQIQISGSFSVIPGTPCMAIADTDRSNTTEQLPPVVVCF